MSPTSAPSHFIWLIITFHDQSIQTVNQTLLQNESLISDLTNTSFSFHTKMEISAVSKYNNAPKQASSSPSDFDLQSSVTSSCSLCRRPHIAEPRWAEESNRQRTTCPRTAPSSRPEAANKHMLRLVWEGPASWQESGSRSTGWLTFIVFLASGTQRSDKLKQHSEDYILDQ